MYRLNRFLILFAISIRLVHGVSAQSPLLENVRLGISDAEKKLMNLRVDGELRIDAWDASRNEWKDAGGSQVTAWYVGLPGSKARIDFHKNVGTQAGDPNSYYQQSYTIVYDGRINQTLYKTEGPPNEQRDLAQGELDSKRSDGIVTGGYASGWNYSLYGCMDRRGVRLSSVLNSKDFSAQVQEIVYQGVNCIQLTVVGRQDTSLGRSEYNTEQTWYLDPARAYAILRYEKATIRPKHAVVVRFTVEKLEEPSPNIFYPVKVNGEAINFDGILMNRGIYTASKTIVNDPDFTEDIFSVKWKPGTQIYDKINDKHFVVDGDGVGVREEIKQQVERARSQIADQHPVSQNPVTDVPARVASRRWFIAGVLLLIVVAAGVTTAVVRRK